MRLVLDAWPLTALLAGSYAISSGFGPGYRLWQLCRIETIQLGRREIDVLERVVSRASEVWTTEFAAAECFHHLERAVGRNDLEELVTWIAERFPPPQLHGVSWTDVVTHEVGRKLGVADASVVLAADRMHRAAPTQGAVERAPHRGPQQRLHERRDLVHGDVLHRKRPLGVPSPEGVPWLPPTGSNLHPTSSTS